MDYRTRKLLEKRGLTREEINEIVRKEHQTEDVQEALGLSGREFLEIQRMSGGNDGGY